MAPANLIDGRAFAEEIHAQTSRRITILKQHGVQPGLAFVRAGEDPASQVYVGMKERISARLGIVSITRVLPEATSEADLLELIARLNADPSIHGILVQAPLPPQLNQAAVYATVLPQKDVDGFHPVNVGKLMLGDTTLTMHLTPGHTLGTISTLIPVRDNGVPHLAAEWGGTGFNFEHSRARFETYAASAQRFGNIVAQSGATHLRPAGKVTARRPVVGTPKCLFIASPG